MSLVAACREVLAGGHRPKAKQSRQAAAFSRPPDDGLLVALDQVEQSLRLEVTSFETPSRSLP